jgi:hypothetical protein
MCYILDGGVCIAFLGKGGQCTEKDDIDFFLLYNMSLCSRM